MFQFQLKYFLISVFLLSTEICIALFAHDRFIRPFFGDFLVVILIYYFIKAFFSLPALSLAIGVLLFAYLIEILQYFNIVNVLGLQHSTIARVIIGTSFEWTDMLAYTLGIVLVLFLEWKTLRRV
ncbi:MAG: DUF2809 domain-containing protein [Bacteroidetes bacterium]|nr:DUF2809 domain-containing protein [Bacteroidota bacterium]